MTDTAAGSEALAVEYRMVPLAHPADFGEAWAVIGGVTRKVHFLVSIFGAERPDFASLFARHFLDGGQFGQPLANFTGAKCMNLTCEHGALYWLVIGTANIGLVLARL